MTLAQAGEQLGPLAHPALTYSDIGPILALTVGALVLLTVAALVNTKPPAGFYALFTLCTPPPPSPPRPGCGSASTRKVLVSPLPT